jgi:hypothetical protein
VLGWKYYLQQFAIIGPTENAVPNTWWLNPAGTFLHGLDALSVKFALEPTFEDIHELEFNIVMVPLTQLLGERSGHADYMRSRQSAGRRRNAEIPVYPVVA